MDFGYDIILDGEDRTKAKRDLNEKKKLEANQRKLEKDNLDFIEVINDNYESKCKKTLTSNQYRQIMQQNFKVSNFQNKAS